MTDREQAEQQWTQATRDQQELLYLWRKLLDIEDKLDRLLEE
jgi:hypothetical protein